MTEGDTGTKMPSAVVQAIGTEINPTNLWQQITPAVGLVAAIALFAFGYRVLNRVLRKASRGRAGV